MSVGICSYRVADSELYFDTRYDGSTRPRRTAIVAASMRFSAPGYEGVGSKAVSPAPLFTHLRGSSVLGSSRVRRAPLGDVLSETAVRFWG